MEGPKRLPFTTLGPPTKEEKKKPVPPTVRFDLALSDSTDTTCPEFFYSELMKTSPGDDLNKSSAASDDPFGDDDGDKLAAIAKAFEAKYNKAGDGKKKKKKKWRDDYLMDLGDGYDESDTFIDNSEAYDEVLPDQYTTKLGGFYINSGRLDLKVVSDDSEEEFMSPPASKEAKKKRRIESDDDSEEEKKPVKKKKLKDGLAVDGEIKRKKKKKLGLPEGEKPFKKPKLPQDKDKQPKQNKSSNVAALIKSTSPNMNGVKEDTNGIVSQESSSDSNEGDPKVTSNISMVIDSVIARVTKDDSNSQEFQEKKDVDPETIVKLPSNLPSGMEQQIDELKKHAKESREGKCKFFTANVNKLLLGVEMSSKQMTVGNRSCMYGHLAAFLPCSKETLLKRAKTLRVKEMEDKIKEPLEKLQQAVSRLMPALLEKYEADCLKAAQDKQEESQKDAVKEGEKDGVKEEGGTESDDEEKTGQDTIKKRQLGPRKKFVWDNNIRSLLCDVVRVKMHSYQMAKARSQTADEYCKTFLDSEVRPIWPKGWMQTRVLYKESKSTHALWTNPQKPKKSMLINKTPTQSLVLSKTQTANSAPPSIAMPKVNIITKGDNPPGASTISPPGTNTSKPDGSNNVSTPVGGISVKKITPTILYSKCDTSDSLSGSSLTPTSVSKGAYMQQAKTAGLSDVSALSPTQLSKVLEARAAAAVGGAGISGQKRTEQSWDHLVSDILRSSLGEQPTIIKSPKAAPVPKSSLSNSSSFMAQYEKYAFSQGSGHPTSSPSSTSPQSANSAQLKKPAQPQTMQKQLPLNLSVSPQQQMMKHQQQILKQQQQQQLVKQQGEDTLKQLHEQQKLLKKQLQQQTAAKQLAEMTAKAKNQPVQKPVVVSRPQAKSSVPNQSPMSMAMSKPLSSGQTGGMAVKKLSTQFNQQAAKNVSYVTENIVRQQLGTSNAAQSLSNTQVKLAQQNIVKSLPYVSNVSTSKVTSDHVYGQILSTSPEGQLRKTSPKSQGTSSHHSPSASLVSVQNAQNSSPRSTGYSSSPGNLASNGKPAVSLLKSLFGQAQSQATVVQSFPGNLQHSLLQAGSPSSSITTSSPQWSPGTLKSSPHGRPSYTGSGDCQAKQFTMPGTSPRQVPGYQGLTLTNEQLAAYEAAQKRLSPEANLFGKGSHVMQRPVQAPHSSLLPSELHYNNLYGYRGYEDNTK